MKTRVWGDDEDDKEGGREEETNKEGDDKEHKAEFESESVIGNRQKARKNKEHARGNSNDRDQR